MRNLIAVAVVVFSIPALAQYQGQYHRTNPAANTAPINPYGNYELRDDSGTYRGQLNSNPYDPNSIANPYGQYGSPYSPDSVNNPYGAGSPYGDSPNNTYDDGWGVYE